MSTDTRLIVHFSCPQCATIYAASQEQRPGRHLGDFYCRNCGTPVHSWTGLYNFSDWMPVSATPSKKRTRQRRCNDNALRLLALLLATLLVLPAIGDPEFGFVGLFILWGLVTVLLCVLFVALWGTGRGRASGGDLK